MTRQASRPTAAPRTRVGPGGAALAVAALALAACQGSDPQPLEPISLDPRGGPESLVDGGGGASLVGYTSSGASAPSGLRLVRAGAGGGPAVLVGDVVFPGGGPITRLRVSDEAAAVIVDGAVWLVDPTSPALSTEPIPASAGASDLAVRGRWVALAVDHGLVLVDRQAPLVPFQQAASSTPAALLVTPTGFLAFTAAGYLVVDTTGATPSFTEVTDPGLSGLQAGRAAGGDAVVAGPGSGPDRTRVLWLDLADPAAPAVTRAEEVPGAFVALAWDGGDGAVVAIHGAGDDARLGSFHQGYLLRGAAGGPAAAGIPLPFWSLSPQPLAAKDGQLFAAQAGGVAQLRIR